MWQIFILSCGFLSFFRIVTWKPPGRFGYRVPDFGSEVGTWGGIRINLLMNFSPIITKILYLAHTSFFEINWKILQKLYKVIDKGVRIVKIEDIAHMTSYEWFIMNQMTSNEFVTSYEILSSFQVVWPQLNRLTSYMIWNIWIRCPKMIWPYMNHLTSYESYNLTWAEMS